MATSARTTHYLGTTPTDLITARTHMRAHTRASPHHRRARACVSLGYSGLPLLATRQHRFAFLPFITGSFLPHAHTSCCYLCFVLNKGLDAAVYGSTYLLILVRCSLRTARALFASARRAAPRHFHALVRCAAFARLLRTQHFAAVAHLPPIHDSVVLPARGTAHCISHTRTTTICPTLFTCTHTTCLRTAVATAHTRLHYLPSPLLTSPLCPHSLAALFLHALLFPTHVPSLSCFTVSELACSSLDTRLPDCYETTGWPTPLDCDLFTHAFFVHFPTCTRTHTLPAATLYHTRHATCGISHLPGYFGSPQHFRVC